jgi:Domain of unknown function (DUF3883)
VLKGDLVAPRLVGQIELGGARGKGLGRAYEQGNVAAFDYEANAVPFDPDVVRDVLFMAECLRKLYRAQDSGQQPGSIPPETLLVAEIASGKPLDRALSRGQGRGLNAEERRTVEQHAMGLAREHLRAQGHKVTDRSATHAFDFEAEKDNTKVLIEVKGTTGRGESILITAGEVRAQRQAHPNNGLIVVHSIELTKSEHGLAAKGGVLMALMPWNISDAALDPLAYSYQLDTNDR